MKPIEVHIDEVVLEGSSDRQLIAETIGNEIAPTFHRRGRNAIAQPVISATGDAVAARLFESTDTGK